MGRTQKYFRAFGTGVATCVLTALVIAVLPLLAIVAFVLRFVLVAAYVVAIPAMAVSPRLRRLVGWDAELAASYRGLRMPLRELLSPQHTWARVERGKVTVGADDFAQKVLGPLDAVELPEVGTVLRQGDPLMTLRHGGRVLTLRAPVAGRVSAVNEKLASEPHLINDAPYGFGWAAVVEPDSLDESKRALKQGKAAHSWLHAEMDRMVALLTSAGEPAMAMADGGQLVDNVHDCIDDDAWNGIKERFFSYQV